MSSNNITMLEVKIVEYLKKLLSEQKDYSYIVYEISNCLEEVNEKNRLKLTINIINNKEFDNILKSYVKNGKLDTKSFPNKYLTDKVIELFLVYCSENNIIYNNLEEDEFNDDLFSIYIKDIIRYPLLADKEQEELLIRIKNGDTDAKKRFIESNLRLTIAILKLYFSCTSDNTVVSTMDLLQEGNLGLMRAVELFDSSLGYKFSTYASLAIKHNIIRCLDNTKRTIRIPVNVKKECNKIVKADDNLYQKLGRKPTTKEIADYVDMTPNKVLHLINISQDIASLDSATNDDSNSTLKEFIVDENVSVEKSALNNVTRDTLVDIIENMNIKRRDKDILYLKYGFVDGKSHTLEEVGSYYNLTRERIRQIEAKVLKQLSRSRKVKKLVGKR